MIAAAERPLALEAAVHSPPAPSPAAPLRWARVFSFPVMQACGLVLLVFLTCRSRFHDPDTWWHLKVGQMIWESRSLPAADTLSYTTGNHAWIPHEWLAEISMYAAWNFGGPRLLWLWMAVIASLLVVVVYTLCALSSGNAKVALLGGLMTWFFGTTGLAIRPLVLGHLFLAIELLVLHLARGRCRWLWTLPPLFAVWVNCHGSYALGLAVLGLALLISFLDVRAGRIFSSRWSVRGRVALALVFALCVAALFVNPVGAKLVTYPLDLLTQQPDNVGNVTEWAPLDVHQVRGAAALAIAAVVALLALARPVALPLEETLLFALGFAMAFRHTRMLFVFGILGAPLLCRLLAGAWRVYDVGRDRRAPNAVLMALAAALIAISVPGETGLRQQELRNNPTGAIDFIRRAGLSGHMLNEYLWGGYLIWALPEQKVFIDGRADVFAWTGVLAAYGRWYTLQDDPKMLLDQHGVDYCLLRKEAPLSQVLPYLPGWKKLYGDEMSVVFGRQ